MPIAGRLVIWLASAIVVIMVLIYGAAAFIDLYLNPQRNDEVRGDPRGWISTLGSLGSTFAPQWTPDGSKIVFMSEHSGTTYVVDKDGRELVSISDKKERLSYDNSHAPVLSPDGTEVLYTTTSFNVATERRRTAYTFEIATADLKGMGKRRLTESNLDQLMPTWSPGGERVAYVRHNPDYDYAQEIVTLTADGQEPERLVTRLKGNQIHGKPMWSLDGSRLFYKTKRLWIYAIGFDGEGPLPIFAPRQGGDVGGNRGSNWSPPFEVKSLPAKSPVNDLVAFLATARQADAEEEPPLMLYLVDTETGDTRMIPLQIMTRPGSYGGKNEITWGPEGNTVLVGMRSYLRVWPNGETSKDQIILIDLTTGESSYLGSGGYAAWSPDKKRIAVVHSLDEIEEA